MNTRRNKIVVTLLTITALLFTGCQEVDDLVSGKTESDIQIDTVTMSYDNEQLDNNSVVTFSIDVANLGGLDLAGVTVQAVLNNTPIGFAQTGALGSVANTDHKADTTLEITWEAVAGEHSAVFYISNETTTAADASDRIDLEVAIAKITIKETAPVTVEKAAEEIAAVVTVDEGTSIAEVVEDIDALIANSDDKSKNEVAMLETIKVVSDNGMTISEEKPTAVTFDDTTVSALLIPLATVVVDDVTGEETTVTEAGSFLVSISTEVEEVVSSVLSDTGVVTVKETKKVSVPLAIKTEESGAITLKNSLGGAIVNTDGTISVLPVVSSRTDTKSFWDTMVGKLETAASTFAREAEAASVLTDLAQNKKALKKASEKFVSAFAGVLQAYDLQSSVSTAIPVITVTGTLKSVDKKAPDEPNNLIRTSYMIFEATVEANGNENVALDASSWDAGIADPFDATSVPTHTFTATYGTSDDVTFEVKTKYIVQVIEDYYAHDQGGNRI